MSREKGLDMQSRRAGHRGERYKGLAESRPSIAKGRASYESRPVANLGSLARGNDEAFWFARSNILAQHAAEVIAALKIVKEGDDV